MNKYDAVVVSLNPCLDWSWHIGDFAHGGMNRVLNSRTDAAGKGINVCLALKNLGLEPLCVGFNFSENGGEITARLDGAGIAHDFITAAGAVRVNIKLYDSAGTMTEINQPGAFVAEAEQAELLKKIKSLSKQCELLILSGSRPAGVPADFYARLCAAWRGRVILDTEGEALRTALDTPHPPFLIKPNLYELETTFGVKLSTQDEIAAFAHLLIQKSAARDAALQMVCVSLGAEGALLVTRGETHHSPALRVPVKAVQGAGDAMVAGLAWGLTQNAPPSDLLRYATAAAAATITLEGTAMCTREGFVAIYEAYFGGLL